MILGETALVKAAVCNCKVNYLSETISCHLERPDSYRFPRDCLYFIPNGLGPTILLSLNIWSLNAPFMEYCLIKDKLRELCTEFNFIDSVNSFKEDTNYRHDKFSLSIASIRYWQFIVCNGSKFCLLFGDFLGTVLFVLHRNPVEASDSTLTPSVLNHPEAEARACLKGCFFFL